MRKMEGSGSASDLRRLADGDHPPTDTFDSPMGEAFSSFVMVLFLTGLG